MNGRLCDRETYLMGEIGEPEAARSEFMERYYSMRDRVPPRVSLDGPASDMELLSEWLSQKAGRKVLVYVPQKGEQAQLVEMCRNNAAEQLAQSVGRTGREASALDELARLLGMAHPPAYIEAYDISNLAGGDNVAGMVVFENGRPLKSAYRKFKIKTIVGQDDYGSMREVIGRRLQEYFANKDSGEGFGRLPGPNLAGRRQRTCGGGEADFGSVWAGHRAVWHGEGRQTPHAGYCRGRRGNRHQLQPEGVYAGFLHSGGGPPLCDRVSSPDEEKEHPDHHPDRN